MPSQKSGRRRTNALSVIGFILSVFPIIPFVGLVFCIIGRKQCMKRNEKGKALATAGLVIWGLFILVSLVGLALLIRSGI